jgi:uncharacterized protein (TIGR02996 family)
MSDDEDFVAAVLAAPDDDTVQLVYADWLEERGDPRGEYLRCWCARRSLGPADPDYLALLQRERDLLRRHATLIRPWQRRLAVGRLRHLLARMQQDADVVGGAEGPDDPYVPGPCLTEGELAAWEAARGLALPEEYRLFLREVGNGGAMPGSYTDFIIEPLAGLEFRASTTSPFPVTADRLRSRLREIKPEDRLTGEVLFPELREYREADSLPPGCLTFGQYPSADSLFLVTAGELRGSVWCAVNYGVPELDRLGEPLGFLAWFEDVVLELAKGA